MDIACPCGLYIDDSYRSKTEKCECTMKSSDHGVGHVVNMSISGSLGTVHGKALKALQQASGKVLCDRKCKCKKNVPAVKLKFNRLPDANLDKKYSEI